ncbi:relaxase/mobilization nuclease domain-containing protein [Chitinophaga japonensis]|uniref:Relaxase/mobilization nuclease-like protein n=1 Tax=Chitinophaga japonensis TaxID=104662 RepID=A0A562T310_CHIJA|nr:relaxase/mobilization nuclease domain-containing protein [Chitinophaga japonensis]TWI87803.1 relaxase/mobilization nuclease-like protein [Chitinophaga japonensis]
MVAVIKTGKSLHRPFNYNENKVAEGKAKCIAAAGYPKDLEDLTLSNKLNLLLRHAELHRRAPRSAVHISLNFDPSENLRFDLKKKTGQDELTRIAADYMDAIGFGGQPYLVYQHFDAGHPHIHIVSVKIRTDGTRIDMQNIGKLKSEPARLNLEKKYNLVPAEDSKRKKTYQLKPVNAAKVSYGKSETRRAIGNVLENVLGTYRYANLPQLNALLRQYNVCAERGSEDSRVFRTGGLYYRVLNDEGEPVGVPIKASSFHHMSPIPGLENQRPTLQYLEMQFTRNRVPSLKYRTTLKNTIDLTFLKHPVGNSLQHLLDNLKSQGVDTVLRRNEEGRVYGITYVDHRNKCVFNGSELGKAYGTAGILQRLEEQGQQERTSFKPMTLEQLRQDSGKQTPPLHTPLSPETPGHDPHIPQGLGLLMDQLLRPEDTYDPIPYEHRLGRKRKKRRKKRTDNNQ